MTPKTTIGTTIGIFGAGQLGKMLGMAAAKFGIECIFYDLADKPCAAEIGKLYTELDKFKEAADIFTYEFEHVEQAILQDLANKDLLLPNIKALKLSSDRKQEKSYLGKLGIPTAKWLSINKPDDIKLAHKELGLPLIIKTTREGYDGKGQMMISTEEELNKAKESINLAGENPYIAERLVPFTREISRISVRGSNGDMVHYPVMENLHKDGILYSTSAPASISANDDKQTTDWMEKLMESLDYIGVLCLELFDTGEGLIANEMAPRVHNSGHWTIEGAKTSQFANHIRAISGMPLGSTQLREQSSSNKMFNLVGRIDDELHTKIAEIENAKTSVHGIHIYGKSPRKGRKLGHLTFSASTSKEMERISKTMHNHKSFVTEK